MKKLIFILVMSLISINSFSKKVFPFVTIKVEAPKGVIFDLGDQPYIGYNNDKTVYFSFKSCLVSKVYLKLENDEIVILDNPKKKSDYHYFVNDTKYMPSGMTRKDIPGNVKSVDSENFFNFDKKNIEKLENIKNNKIVKIRVEQDICGTPFLHDYNIEIDMNYVIQILENMYNDKMNKITQINNMKNKDNVENF